MRTAELKKLFEPMVGMVLMGIEDADRQEQVDDAMKVIQGWDLRRVSTGKVESTGHPQRVTDVHLHFAASRMMPEFALSVRAKDVHEVSVQKVERECMWHTRVGILFKRGHRVTLELA